MLVCPLRLERPVLELPVLPDRLDDWLEEDTDDEIDADALDAVPTEPTELAGGDAEGVFTGRNEAACVPVPVRSDRPAGGRPQSSQIPSTIFPEQPGR